MHPAIKPGNVAVITGAAFGGIGYAMSKRLLQLGLKVVLADNSTSYLKKASEDLTSSGIQSDHFLTVPTDVASSESCTELAKEAFATFKRVDILHCNAGIHVPAESGNTFRGIETWHKVMGVNLFGVINTVQAFVERMLDRQEPGLIVVTGSKQGITCPPGNATYNVSKAALRTYTEQLSYELRQKNDKISAALLVPGYVYTKLTSQNKSVDEPSQVPKDAWSADQVVEYCLAKLNEDKFYIICPDGQVTTEMDKGRMAWSLGDLIEERPALSRWDPKYKSEFETHMKQFTG